MLPEAKERELAAAEHPKILEAFGGEYDDAALLSGGSGDGNACVAALDAAERDVPVSDTRQREQEPQGTIEKTKKKSDKVIEDLGGNLLKGLFGN